MYNQMMKKIIPYIFILYTYFGLNYALILGANNELIPNAIYNVNNDITPKSS